MDGFQVLFLTSGSLVGQPVSPCKMIEYLSSSGVADDHFSLFRFTSADFKCGVQFNFLNFRKVQQSGEQIVVSLGSPAFIF